MTWRNDTTRMYSTLQLSLAVLTLVATVLGGCAYGSTAPSRQMEPGDAHTTGTLSWGPIRGGPRAEVGRRYGVEHGDLGVHAGWTPLLAINGGASARSYVAPWLNAGLHVDGGFLIPGQGPVPGWLAWTGRLTTATHDGQRLYGGLQFNATQYFKRGFGSPIFVGGLVGGAEFEIGSTIAQIELVLTPVVHQSFERRDRNDQPRTSFDQFAVGPGPFDSPGQLSWSFTFSQLNVILYND